MRKLSLKSLNLNDEETLLRNQLESVLGGYSGGNYTQCTREVIRGSTNGMDGVYITCYNTVDQEYQMFNVMGQQVYGCPQF